MKFYTIDRKLNNFNDFIRGELKRKKISQSDCAYRLGIPQSALSYRLSGHTEWTLREVFLMCEILEMDIGDIL